MVEGYYKGKHEEKMKVKPMKEPACINGIINSVLLIMTLQIMGYGIYLRYFR
jgi:hypothetical protein